jgi:hypothetical protein
MTMMNGVATFDVPQWLTSGTPVPVTQSGIQASLTWTMRVDGLAFVNEPMGTMPYAPTGLLVDTTDVVAVVPAISGARITTRTTAGTPSSVALGDADFLPVLEAAPAAPTIVPTVIEWSATASDGDALHVHASWTVGVKVSGVVPPGPHRVVWDAILPPDARSVTLPKLDGDLQTAIAPPGIAPNDVLLRAIDSSALDGFAALVGAGIHAEETLQVSPIVEAPVGGQVRVSQSIGGQQ